MVEGRPQVFAAIFGKQYINIDNWPARGGMSPS